MKRICVLLDSTHILSKLNLDLIISFFTNRLTLTTKIINNHTINLMIIMLLSKNFTLDRIKIIKSLKP